MNKDIDLYVEKSFIKIENDIRDKITIPFKDLLEEIIKQKSIFYGKTAIEILLKKNITQPFYIISDKDMLDFKPIFASLHKKYGVFYNVRPISDNVINYTLNLQSVMIVYTSFKNTIIDKVDNYIIVPPIYSLIDIYYKYSTPVNNIDYWIENSKIDKEYMKYFIKNNKIKNSKIKINNQKIYKKVYDFINKYYLKGNNLVMISGIYAYNNMMNTNYYGIIDLLVNDVNELYPKLDFLMPGLSKIESGDYLDYFTVYKVFYKKIHIINFFEMNEPLSYYKKFSRSNYHTTIIILLLNSILSKQKIYLRLAKQLIVCAHSKDILTDNKFKCFQNTYLDKTIEHFLYLKNINYEINTDFYD